MTEGKNEESERKRRREGQGGRGEVNWILEKFWDLLSTYNLKNHWKGRRRMREKEGRRGEVVWTCKSFGMRADLDILQNFRRHERERKLEIDNISESALTSGRGKVREILGLQKI